MNWALTKIQSFLSDASKGEGKLSPELVEEFKELCGKALERQFNEKRDKWRLRMSEVGKPLCQQKLKKKGIKQEYEYNSVMRFLIGDLIEASAVVIMKGAGVNVQELQKEVKTKVANIELKGTYDIKIDDKVWDIKSASPFMFDNKFGEWGGYTKIKDDDTFGYVAQGFSYAHADNCDFGGWIAVNKSTGEWAICEVPEQQEHEKLQALRKIKSNIENIDKEFERCFEDIPESYKTYAGKNKGKVTYTGNRLMTYPCTFCGYKKHCWKDAELSPKVSSRAKHPPYVWYSKLEKRELK